MRQNNSLKFLPTYLNFILFLVLLGGMIASCSKSDDTNPPAGTTTISSITTPGGTASGPKNTIITINGTNFITDLSKIQVKVNGKVCEVLTATTTVITAKIPASCGTGIVELFLDGARYPGPVFTYVYTSTLTSVTNGVVGNVYGPISTAQFDEIESVSIDQNNNLFIGQFSNPKIRKISAAGIVSLLAGSGVQGHADGNGANAQFNSPEYTSPGPDGNLYVAEDRYIRKVDPAGNVSTLYTFPITAYMGVKAMPSGIYVAGYNHIAKVSYAGVLLWKVDSKVFTPQDGDFDGDTSVASFHIYGNIEVDASEENIYFNNYNVSGPLVNNHPVNKLKKLNIPSHTISTLAGCNSTVEGQDGAASQATLNQLSDIRLDSTGALLLADSRNHKIRKYKDGQVSTLIGNLGPGDVDGDLSVAKLNFPTGIYFDTNGVLYIACYGNNKLKKFTID